MTRKYKLVALGMVMWLISSCAQNQQRPANVPSDAVKVIAAKGTGPWQWCELTHGGKIHCHFYNNKGETLCDDIFVVYSGTEPKSNSDLTISENGGQQWVRLENGTVLIPRTDEAEIRRGLDWLFGKRATR